MSNYSLRGISRIHSKRAGWLVRLYRNAKVLTKLFSDGVYGNSDKALKAAQSYQSSTPKSFSSWTDSPSPLQHRHPLRRQ